MVLLVGDAAALMWPSEGGSTSLSFCDILLPMKATLDIATLTAFVTVVRAGTFTAAARTLRTHKTHLSRVVNR
jgi:hypothetical protein